MEGKVKPFSKHCRVVGIKAGNGKFAPMAKVSITLRQPSHSVGKSERSRRRAAFQSLEMRA